MAPTIGATIRTISREMAFVPGKATDPPLASGGLPELRMSGNSWDLVVPEPASEMYRSGQQSQTPISHQGAPVNPANPDKCQDARGTFGPLGKWF